MGRPAISSIAARLVLILVAVAFVNTAFADDSPRNPMAGGQSEERAGFVHPGKVYTPVNQWDNMEVNDDELRSLVQLVTKVQNAYNNEIYQPSLEILKKELEHKGYVSKKSREDFIIRVNRAVEDKSKHRWYSELRSRLK